MNEETLRLNAAVNELHLLYNTVLQRCLSLSAEVAVLQSKLKEQEDNKETKED